VISRCNSISLIYRCQWLLTFIKDWCSFKICLACIVNCNRNQEKSLSVETYFHDVGYHFFFLCAHIFAFITMIM
jgi:hypothetical protein